MVHHVTLFHNHSYHLSAWSTCLLRLFVWLCRHHINMRDFPNGVFTLKITTCAVCVCVCVCTTGKLIPTHLQPLATEYTPPHAVLETQEHYITSIKAAWNQDLPSHSSHDLLTNGKRKTIRKILQYCTNISSHVLYISVTQYWICIHVWNSQLLRMSVQFQ